MISAGKPRLRRKIKSAPLVHILLLATIHAHISTFTHTIDIHAHTPRWAINLCTPMAHHSLSLLLVVATRPLPPPLDGTGGSQAMDGDGWIKLNPLNRVAVHVT